MRNADGTLSIEGSSIQKMLTYCVPDLKFDVLILNLDCARPELHPNGQVMRGLEALVCELKEKA